MKHSEIIEADLTWTGERFERGARVAVDAGGTIADVGQLSEKPTRRLKYCALIPGFVNAHSHAFQRGLRGHGEHFPDGAGSFWSWREAMYQLVQSLDEDSIYTLSKLAFSEMLSAGITTVGEFHYLHHDSSNANYSFDEIVLRAAKDAGIRIALLNTYYESGGISQPLKGGQLRFQTKSLDEFWSHVDRLTSKLDSASQSCGIAAHSIRAVPLEKLQELQQESIRRRLPFHMHVEEQPLEIEDSVREFGKPPLAVLNEHLTINPMFTAVHCTHSAAADIDEFLATGGNVCICPLTEANLGDGIPNLSRILKSQGCISLGTDSNARISMTEELRWLEYVQRLSTQQRGICVDKAGKVAKKLLESATINGARSLGIKTGRIQPGYLADFVAIDLNEQSLSGWTDDTLLDSFIFGTGNEAIAEKCVGGKWFTPTN